LIGTVADSYTFLDFMTKTTHEEEGLKYRFGMLPSKEECGSFLVPFFNYDHTICFSVDLSTTKSIGEFKILAWKGFLAIQEQEKINLERAFPKMSYKKSCDTYLYGVGAS
jgi:hypothetical protein